MAVTTNFGVPTTDGNGTLMPKLQYRYRVTFQNMGTGSSTVVTRNVVSVTRPAVDHDDVTIDTYNSKIRLAGKHTWQDVTLVMRDDVASEVIKKLNEQMQTQLDHENQSAPLAGVEYKFGMKIETLDGSNGDGFESVLDTWTLAGCFIPSIQFGDLNYSTSDVVQVTATIRYDNASNETNNVSSSNTAVGGDNV